jgi:hypothetical protein
MEVSATPASSTALIVTDTCMPLVKAARDCASSVAAS